MQSLLFVLLYSIFPTLLELGLSATVLTRRFSTVGQLNGSNPNPNPKPTLTLTLTLTLTDQRELHCGERPGRHVARRGAGDQRDQTPHERAWQQLG